MAGDYGSIRPVQEKAVGDAGSAVSPLVGGTESVTDGVDRNDPRPIDCDRLILMHDGG